MTVAIYEPCVPVLSADQWVEIIKGDLYRTVEGFVTAGAHLREAKAAVEHGEWLPMLGRIGVHRAVADRLMMIARNGAIANSSNWSNLPTAERALYEMARAPSEAIEAALEDGTITPKTTIPQARAFATPHHRQPPQADPKPPPEPKQKVTAPLVEANLMNALIGMFRPDRIDTYSPKFKHDLIALLDTTLTNLKAN